MRKSTERAGNGVKESKARGTFKLLKCQMGEQRTTHDLQIALVLVPPRLLAIWHARPRFGLTNLVTEVPNYWTLHVYMSPCTPIARPTTENGDIFCKLLPSLCAVVLKLTFGVAKQYPMPQQRAQLTWRHVVEPWVPSSQVHNTIRPNGRRVALSVFSVVFYR
jgi:hypothetical protein